VTATRLGVITYIIPFMFVYAPALLMSGPKGEVALAFVTSILGCIALAGGFGGYLLIKKVSWVQRPLLIVSSLLLMYPGRYSDLLGFGLLGVALLLWRKRRAQSPQNAVGIREGCKVQGTRSKVKGMNSFSLYGREPCTPALNGSVLRPGPISRLIPRHLSARSAGSLASGCSPIELASGRFLAAC